MKLKYFNKYLCPNILVDFEKTMHINKKKKIIFYLLPHWSQVLTAQVGVPVRHFIAPQTSALEWKPPPWLPAAHCTTRYRFALQQLAETSLYSSMTSPKRMSCVPVVKLNYLELVVHTVPDRCQEVMYFPQLFKIFPGTLLHLLQCLGCPGSWSENWKAHPPFQTRSFFYASVSQHYELDIIDTFE